MDGGGSHRAEAERWLTAAEKLLATRDFHGTKSFAYRARECDPRLEASDRIIAVVDTLLAAERLINQHLDWYAILQLGHLTQGVDLIAEHYRRLALLLNPEYNRFPYADQAFRHVSEAWTVLSNPSKKSFYDNEIRMIQFGQVGFQTPKKTPPNREPTTTAVVEERSQLFDNGGESDRQPQPPQAHPAAPLAATTQQSSGSQESTNFWTTCPYCYVLYEYPRAYEDCALKCQVCERSFQAVAVPPPPVTEEDTFYNCWAYFPLAYSGEDTGPDGGFSWKPFSPMFQPNASKGTNAAPVVHEKKGASKGTNATPMVHQKKKAASKGTNAAPRVYYDDDDVYVEVSDSSDDSDDSDWDKSGPRKKKRRGRPPKDKSPSSKGTRTTRETPGDDRNPPAVSGGVQNPAMQGSERVEPSRKGAANAAVRKQGGRGAKALGKLDLNVEFNNEVEESSRAATASRGHGRVPGVDDNIEGTGFFEGLDEFLNSLPILSAVGDDKVKAA